MLPQTKHSAELLNLFVDYVQPDAAYVARLKKHYAEVKRQSRKGDRGQPPPAGHPDEAQSHPSAYGGRRLPGLADVVPPGALMYYYDAVAEILDKAARVKLPGHRADAVTAARREFAKRG